MREFGFAKERELTERRTEFKCEDCDYDDTPYGQARLDSASEENRVKCVRQGSEVRQKTMWCSSRCRVNGEFPTSVAHCKELFEQLAIQPDPKCHAKKL